jgi:hypothetical protein
VLAVLVRFRDEIEDGYILGPVRAVVGVLLGWQALSAAEELARGGYFGDTFHVPMIPEGLVPSPRVYAVVLAARVCFAVMVTIGVWARPALLASAGLGFFILLSNRNQFHHSRYSLYCYALLVALTPCDRSWRASEPAVPEPRRGPWWGVRLSQFQVSLIYLASGGSKLLDPDWRDGLVVGERIARYAHVAVARGVPHEIVDVLARPDVSSGVAKLAITTELFRCVALWLRPTRVFALFLGLWFHVMIQATSNVESFSVLALALYGVYVTPDYRSDARLVRTLSGRALGARRSARSFDRDHPTRRRASDGRSRVRDAHALPAAALPDLGSDRAPLELHAARRSDDARLTPRIARLLPRGIALLATREDRRPTRGRRRPSMHFTYNSTPPISCGSDRPTSRRCPRCRRRRSRSRR